jgi:tRNA(Ile2) C34 agmatinyltransferase TiaS
LRSRGCGLVNSLLTAEERTFFRQRSRSMTCPQCTTPMTAISTNSFRCDPCREIVIVFAVASKFLSPKSLPTSVLPPKN